VAAGRAGAALYGVNAHVPPPQVLDEIAESGARWVRIDFIWSWVEPQPDRFEWALYDEVVDGALARGLRVFATIGDTPAWATDGAAGSGVPRGAADFYDLCYRAAARYRGRVEAWGMWNEPNLRRFWSGSRTQYLERVLIPGAEAVHAADPRALVCGPELAHLQSADWDSWLRDVLKRASSHLDVVTHHLYPDGSSSRSVLGHLKDGGRYPWDPPSVRAVLQDAGWLGRPFWLTETGCSSGASGSGEAAQAAFVANLTQSLFGPDRSVTWVHAVFFYEIADDPRYAWAALGLLGPPPDYRRKQSFDELRRVAAELEADDAEVVGLDVPDWLPPGAQATATVVLRNTGTTTWRRADGYRLAGDVEAGMAATRVDLEIDEEVQPGQERAFAVTLTAPDAAPAAPVAAAWQVIREGRWRFGEVARAAVAIGDGAPTSSWLVPFVAGSAAAGRWSSDLALHNPGAVALTARLRLLLAGADNAFARTLETTVAPGATVVLDDLVRDRFGTAGRGVLRVEAPSAALLAAGATSVAATGGAATVRIAGVPSGSAGPQQQASRLLRLARAGDGTGMRTELLLAATGEDDTAVDIEVLDRRGLRLGSLALLLAPHGVASIDDVLGAVGVTAAEHAQAVVRAAGGAAVRAWAIKHEGSTSAVEVIAAEEPSDVPLVVLPIESSSRFRGRAWRTELQLANGGAEPALVTVAMLAPAGQPPAVAEVELEVEGGESLVVADAPARLFGFRGSGALLVTPRTGAVTVAAGIAASRGSVLGRAVGSVPLGRAVGDGETCRIFPVTHPADTPGSRTHLAIANPGDTAVVVRVLVKDASGTTRRTLLAVVGARGYRQVTDVLAAGPAFAGGPGVIVLGQGFEGGRFVAHATVVGPDGERTFVPCT